jgi:hypothetical protein
MQAGHCYCTFQKHCVPLMTFDLRNNHSRNILGQDQEFWMMNVVKWHFEEWWKSYNTTLILWGFCHLGGEVVSVLVTGPKGCGFEPGQGNGFLRAIKILSTSSFGWEVKPEAPTHKIWRHVKDLLMSHWDGQTKFSFPSPICPLSHLLQRSLCWQDHQSVLGDARDVCWQDYQPVLGDARDVCWQDYQPVLGAARDVSADRTARQYWWLPECSGRQAGS